MVSKNISARRKVPHTFVVAKIWLVYYLPRLSWQPFLFESIVGQILLGCVRCPYLDLHSSIRLASLGCNFNWHSLVDDLLHSLGFHIENPLPVNFSIDALIIFKNI